MTQVDLEAAWAALEASAPDAGDIRMAPLPAANDQGALFAGRDSQGRIHLLMPLAPGTPVRPDRRSRGVSIERNELIVDARRRPFVDVVCHEPRLQDVFRGLAAEMVQRVTESPTSSVIVCHSVLARWRDLLERRRAKLGADALVGLFGELVMLRLIVARDPDRRVDCWTGPTGAAHDFSTPGVSLEVKTSRRREGRFAEINGAEQLDSPDDIELFLAYLRVEARPNGETVQDIVDGLKSKGVEAGQLDRLVALTGWEASQTDEEETLHVVEQRLYRVDEHFPRITPLSFRAGTLPPGVLRLRYEVDLTGAQPAHLAGDQIEEVVRRMAGQL